MSLIESFLRRSALNPSQGGNDSENLGSLLIFLELG